MSTASQLGSQAPAGQSIWSLGATPKVITILGVGHSKFPQGSAKPDGAQSLPWIMESGRLEEIRQGSVAHVGFPMITVGASEKSSACRFLSFHRRTRSLCFLQKGPKVQELEKLLRIHATWGQRWPWNGARGTREDSGLQNQGFPIPWGTVKM